MEKFKKQIFNALMSGYLHITVNNIELTMKPLKKDTLKNKEREANRIASKLVKLVV